MNVLMRQEQEQGIPIEEDVDLLAETQAQVAMAELFPMIRALGKADAEALAAGREARGRQTTEPPLAAGDAPSRTGLAPFSSQSSESEHQGQSV
jgi:hypothetical protein